MWHTISKEETLKRMRVNEKEGLKDREVIKRQKEFGKNELQEKKKETVLIKFIKQFNDFMIIILIIASIVSAGISFIQNNNEYIDSIIILLIVVLNAIMGVIQETKAEKSIQALRNMTPVKARAIRNGQTIQINANEIVPGDIIILKSGDYVPADARLLESIKLKVEESSLTGENEAIEKDANKICDKQENGIYCRNMIYMGTMVVNGNAKAIVTDIGMNTKVGQIAEMITESEESLTPLQKKLEQVGKVLGIICLIICIVIFLIGILKKISPTEMFMTSVGLAVAAIPEGLPAIVTIMLSIGVTKLARKNSIIRKLPAVETLGSSNVICSDKTGTLTQNKMKVVEVESNDIRFTLELATMCNNCELINKNNQQIVEGEATEKAIMEYALKKQVSKKELYSKMERIYEIPFDSNRKMMTTIHRYNSGYRVITKGAPDILLEKCEKVYINGKVEDITYSLKEKIKRKNEYMANRALRVIAVAYIDMDKNPINNKNLENNLIFVGLIGMIDPPREGVKESVSECKKAGIKTVMITGDHIVTAKAIAKDIGIFGENDKAITGKELDKMSQKQLEKEINKYSVFARVTPEHKVRIVKAWQNTGAVVAMTGDGVNDSPALKSADIGIAMGKNGTDVAKNAVDMILTDDNFVTIIEAVKQGRNIYNNIKKAIHFLISTNIGEIVTIFMGLVLGFKSPLLAIQLIWINLITDSLPAIALGLEKTDEDIMKKKPINSKKGFFADGLLTSIILEGTVIGLLTLVAFSIGNKYYSVEVGRTMAFVSLSMLELIHCFNIKSEKSIIKSKVFDNKYLNASFLIGTILQILVVIIPPIAKIFQVVPLTNIQWGITLTISLMIIPVMELQKSRKHFTNAEKYGKISMLKKA